MSVDTPNRSYDIVVGTYRQVADEYYDAKLHPTCASLRELSEQYISEHLQAIETRFGAVLEVGAGRSVVAPLLAAAAVDLSCLTLIDSSVEMLSYSSSWADKGAKLIEASADATGLDGSSVSLIFSSLGDPYNTPAFWGEVARILEPNGVCHFTTPAFEWSTRFRAETDSEFAEFLLSGGSTLLLPSKILSVEDQLQMFAGAGLKVVASGFRTALDLSSIAAPKLLCVGSGVPLVRGFSVCHNGKN